MCRALVAICVRILTLLCQPVQWLPAAAQKGSHASPAACLAVPVLGVELLELRVVLAKGALRRSLRVAKRRVCWRVSHLEYKHHGL